MDYITHKRFKQKGISGKTYNLPYGTRLRALNGYLIFNNEPICALTSENAHIYFSRNDDGQGLERGRLTYAIAYANRKPNKDNSFRFTEEERDLLYTEYPHFLIDDNEWLLFNHDFFNADVNELKELAKKLHIKIK